MLTTVSAVVFIYASDISLAAISVLNMDDAGDIAPAAAMALMIAYTCLAARGIHALVTLQLQKKPQAWRKR